MPRFCRVLCGPARDGQAPGDQRPGIARPAGLDRQPRRDRRRCLPTRPPGRGRSTAPSAPCRAPASAPASFSQASIKPFGGSGSFRYASSLPDFAQRLAPIPAPMPIATRRGVPNRLPSTGMVWPLGFSNSSAGPPARNTRSQISVISRSGIDLDGDALELALVFQLGDEIAQVLVFHERGTCLVGSMR